MLNQMIGEKIRTIRKKKGMSQEKLAAKAGIDRTYLAGIEAGKKNITLQVVENISIALDTEIRDLFDF